MHIFLKSDFRDYYDHWFYSERASQTPADAVFTRTMSKGMSRPVMMRYMRDIGLETPRFGIVGDLIDRLGVQAPVVVHLDVRAHAGEGKVLMSVADAVKQYPDKLCIEHISDVSPKTSGGARSFRLLKIGKRYFGMKYESKNDWRSNAGDVQISRLTEMTGLPSIPHQVKKISHPLFAIDFALRDDGKAYAIDFNESPGLRGTGIEDIVSGKEVYDQIANTLANVSCR